MKRNILYSLVGLTIVLLFFACSEEDRYETSVVRQFELSLNGEPWSLNTGISTKPLFIYDAKKGDFVANYTSHYRFVLDNKSHKFVATTSPEALIADSIVATNLNELIIYQFPKADQKVEISAATEYNSPFDEILKFDMLSRTGTLRLRATDTKADKSYSTVRAIVTPKRSGYRVLDETYVESPIEIARSKVNATGGVNYTDDFIVFKTQDAQNGIHVRFELLDKDAAVVHTKQLEGTLEVFSDNVTLVEFKLNDTDKPIIQDYKVTILSEDWTEEEFNPEAPFDVPEGYIYVSPSEDLETIYSEMLNNPSVNEIKLYLKAGTTYNLGRISILKGLSVLGQVPKAGENKTVLNFAVSKIEGNLDNIHFEGLDIVPGDSYMFNLDKEAAFRVNQIVFRNCHIDNIKRNLWRQETTVSGLQSVDKFILDDVRMLNLASESNYATFAIAANNPIRNISINKTTMHVLGTGYRKSFIEGTRNQSDALSIIITNSTFIRLGNADMTMFDLRADASPSINVTVKNNVFSGISTAGKGRWMYLSNSAVKDIVSNYHTNDFVLNTWGVGVGEEPIATVTKETLFIDCTSGDLTIKDKTSAVYTNRVGDPRWID